MANRTPPADQCAGQARPWRVVADLYRRRWTIETAFAEMEKVLNGEINALGYPKAALFSFCMALVAYNVLSTVKGAPALGAW